MRRWLLVYVPAAATAAILIAGASFLIQALLGLDDASSSCGGG
jgi:hypothetical protein